MARSFNGSTDKITTANTISAVASPASWASWVYITGGAAANRGIWTDASGNNATYIKSSNLFGVIFIASGNSSYTPTLNVWTHLGWSFSSGTITFYANGASQGTASVTANTGTASDWIIGTDNSGNPFPGNLADFAYWTVALASTDMANLAAGTRPGAVSAANLQLWYPFDGFASPETDASANGNNGTLTGTARVLGPPALWRISA